MPTAGEVAKESAASTVAGKVTGGLLGGFGGFGKKKKKEEEQKKQEEQQKAAAPQAQKTAGVLLESNTEMTAFSSAPIDPTKLEVPAGYKQVEAK
jgi:Na+/glutamate symporter